MQTVEQLLTRRAQRVTRLRELRVPHVERGEQLRVRPLGCGLTQQRVALPQDAVEVGTQRVVARVERDEHVVDVAPSLARPGLHEREVVGGEHGRAQRAEQVAGPPERLAVHRHAPAPARRDLSLEEQLAVLALPLGTHDGPCAPLTHERVVRHAAEGRESGEVADRLEQAGLALSVVALHDGEARRERQVE